jgi:hypothetical protein
MAPADESPKKKEPQMDQVKSFLAGGAAGVSAVLVGVSLLSSGVQNNLGDSNPQRQQG